MAAAPLSRARRRSFHRHPRDAGRHCGIAEERRRRSSEGEGTEHCGIEEDPGLGLKAVATMDVFLMIRRHRTTIFTDAKESTTVLELKKVVEGILKRLPEDQRLYKDDQLLEDGKTLGDCGFTSQTARPQAPATVGLAFNPWVS
ncbi:elongin-B [Cetorhinus maximus]